MNSLTHGYAKLATWVVSLTMLIAVNGYASGLQSISDAEMAEVVGQALFVADKIEPNSLPGAGGAGSTTDFTYYRLGLDVLIEMNMNIDRLQLGCGGVNDAIAPGCDIDLEHVRLMGRNPSGGQTSPDGIFQQGQGSPVTSDFELLRPYIEIAIKNDHDRTAREVAGIKVGAESVDGYLGIGEYRGPGNHVGINSISGFLNASLSVYLSFTSGLGSGNACVGRPAGRPACDGVVNNPVYPVPAARTTGTRQQRLQVPDAPVEEVHGGSGFIGLFEGETLFLNLDQDLNYLHGIVLPNTGDFFMSMQREQIRYPSVDKSGYAVAANTGWWMNIPNAELTDLEPPTVDLGCPGFICLGLLDGFSSPGIGQSNVDLGSRPPNNCYGATEFC